jgi:hypothetical protein
MSLATIIRISQSTTLKSQGHDKIMSRIFLADITQKLQPRTVKLRGTVKNSLANILVDSHSTHNLIHINVAKRLNLFVFPTKIPLLW